jgi:hypothetical protein
MATYTYDLSDFPNGKFSSSLYPEILASTIVPAFTGPSSSGTTVSLVFKADLSGAEQTLLDAIVAAHQGVEPEDPARLVRLRGPEDPDHKPIVTISPATIGLKTWLTGAGDGEAAANRALGEKIQLKFTDTDTAFVDFNFNECVEVHDGQLNWGPDGAWSCDDRFSLSVNIPATTVSVTPGTGNVNEIALGGGLVAYVPAAGDGLHTLETAAPIVIPDDHPLASARYWNVDTISGAVTSLAEPTGNCVLLNAPQEAFFVTNIGMGNRFGLFDVDVYRTDWIHKTWSIRLYVEKVTAGAGWVDGWMLVFRPSNTRT